jgi:hypothetical protein
MPCTSTLVVSISLFAAACATPVLAASSTASMASESVGTSVGSASTSVQGSSNSSARTAGVAQGDYRLIELAAVTAQPGMVRLQLQALAEPGAAGRLTLHLPQQAVDAGRLAQGELVSARHRAYGIEFARADTRQAFFLVLDDDWYHELQARPLVL